MKVAVYAYKDLEALLGDHESVTIPALDKQSGPLTVIRRPDCIAIVDDKRRQRVGLYDEGQSLRHRAGQLTRFGGNSSTVVNSTQPAVVGLIKGVHSFAHGPYRIRIIPPERYERIRLEDLLPALIEIRQDGESVCGKPVSYKVRDADAGRWQLCLSGEREQSVYLLKSQLVLDRSASLAAQAEALVIVLLKERSFLAMIDRDK